MSEADKRPTAQDFRDPLLKVLATMVDFKPGVYVQHIPVYERVCEVAGITIDQYGEQEDTKQPWVKRWIQWAFRDIKKEGLAQQPGKGKWALTKEGVTEAERIMTQTAADTVVETVPAGDDISMPVSAGLKADDSTYHEDQYIVSLAIKATRCSGFYSTRATLCTGSDNVPPCPVRAACITQMANTLSNLSSVLIQEDARKAAQDIAIAEANERAKSAKGKKAKEAAAADVAAASADDSGSTVKPPTGGWDNTGVKKIKAALDAKCTRCGGLIKKGTPCHWIRSKDSSDNGVFHIECLNA